MRPDTPTLTPDPDGLPRILDDADPILVLDGKGVCRYANAAAGTALAVDSPALLGRRAAADLAAAGEPELQRAIATARSTGLEQHVELRHPRSGCLLEGRIVPDGDRVAIYLHDVTARHRREAALTRARHELLSSVAGGATGSFSIDLPTGDATLAPEVLQIHGLDPAGGTRRRWVEVRSLIHPEDRSRTAQALTESAARPGTFTDITYRVVRASTGQVRLVHEVSVVLVDGQGRPLSVSGSMTDITELQAAQEALEASERRLTRTLEALNAIVCTMEYPGAPIVANAHVEKVLGYRPDELATLDAWDSRIHPDDLPGCQAAWARAGEPWHLRYRIRHKDGHWVWLDDRGRWIEGDVRGSGMFAIAVDISGAIEAEPASSGRLTGPVADADAPPSGRLPGADAPQSEPVARREAPQGSPGPAVAQTPTMSSSRTR